MAELEPSSALMGLEDLPTAATSVTTRLVAAGERLVAASERLEAAKAELESAQDEYTHMSCRELPDLFDEASTDQIGVPSAGVSVVLGMAYYANIPVDWDADRRERGFVALEMMGGGDLIQNTVSVAFARTENDLTADFVEYISRWNGLGGRQIDVKRGVNWSSLTAWFRRRMEVSEPPRTDIEAIGGKITRHAKILNRKKK